MHTLQKVIIPSNENGREVKVSLEKLGLLFLFKHCFMYLKFNVACHRTDRRRIC